MTELGNAGSNTGNKDSGLLVDADCSSVAVRDGDHSIKDGSFNSDDRLELTSTAEKLLAHGIVRKLLESTINLRREAQFINICY